MYANGLVRYLKYGGVGRGGWVATKYEEDGKAGGGGWGVEVGVRGVGVRTQVNIQGVYLCLTLPGMIFWDDHRWSISGGCQF